MKEKSEKVDLVKEFETDVFLRTGITVTEEDWGERALGYGQGLNAYRTVAKADHMVKAMAILPYKKA